MADRQKGEALCKGAQGGAEPRTMPASTAARLLATLTLAAMLLACGLLPGLSSLPARAAPVSQDAQSSQRAPAVPAAAKSILILNSHQQGLPIPDGVVVGLLSTLRESKISTADVFIEHLDLLRFNSPEHRAELARYLAEKLAGRTIDMIVTVSAPALDFLNNEGKGLFPHAPVLATIVPSGSVQEPAGRPLAVLPWRLDSAGTLRYALRLFPGTRRVVVVTGAHDEFLPYLADAREDFAAFKDTLTFEYTSELSFPDMLRRISSLPGDSVVLYAPYFADVAGRSYIPAEVSAAVAQAANVPAFAMIDTFLRDGFVGGSMLSSRDLGMQAGRFARDILNGTIRIEERTMLVNPNYFPMFDWPQLTRWGRGEARLPAGSVIVDRKPTLWGQYKAAVLGVAGVSVLLLALIVALSLQNMSRKRAEYAARMSEERYLTLFERSPDAIIVFNTQEERIVDANSNAEKLFGCSREELLRWGTRRFEPPRQASWTSLEQTLREHVGQTLGGGQAVFEEDILTADGRIVFCEVRLAGLPSMGGKLIRAGFLDITERKEAEAALRESVDKFQGLFERSPLAMMLLDADGVVINANPAVEPVFGVPSEKYAGINLAESMTDAHHRDSLIKGLREGQSHALGPYTSFLSHKNLILKSTVKQISPNLFLIFAEDVTELKRMQEAMVQSEKMMSVGGLAAGMAHEINNPLSGIMQSVQVVKKRIEADLPANALAAEEAGCGLDRIRTYLEKREILTMLDGVGESARRAAAIVRNMLEFSRKSDQAPAPTDLNALLDKALELSSTDYDLKKKYDFRKIAIVRDYASGLPPISCNPGMLEQVFLNLLRNAAQAMAGSPPGTPQPRIVLRTRWDGDAARAEIEDNGPGMDEQTRRRAFEPFFTTKMQGEGTGLGLSVSYFIITNTLGGSIEVESQPGQGSKFIIRLPLGRERESHA